MTNHTTQDIVVNKKNCEDIMRESGWVPVSELTDPKTEPPHVSAFRVLFNDEWIRFVEQVGEGSAMRFFNRHSHEFSHVETWHELLLRESSSLTLTHYGLFGEFERETTPSMRRPRREWEIVFYKVLKLKFTRMLTAHHSILPENVVHRVVVSELSRRYAEEDMLLWAYTIIVLWLYKGGETVGMKDVTSGVFGNLLVTDTGMKKCAQAHRRLVKTEAYRSWRSLVDTADNMITHKNKSENE